MTKQKQVRGEQSKTSKLTDVIVKNIRRQYKNKYHHGIKAKLARKYGVSIQTISTVVNGHTWKHVK